METTLEAPLQPSTTAPRSRFARRAGIGLSALPIAFLLFDASIKIAKLPFVVEGTVRVGFSEGTIQPLGIILLTCVVLYAVPRTAVLGAVLLTAYLGGAVATHVRLGDPLFSHILFPVYVAILAWGGLYLRDARVRALSPWNFGRNAADVS